jgi:Uma2 family endonuclease
MPAKPIECLLIRKPVIVYPESDGEPMGETEWHVFTLAALLQVLQERFKDRPDVHPGGNLFLYFEEGDPTEVVCPDVFVAFGAKPGLRRTWKTWEEEGLFPQVILELLSTSTRRTDLGAKRGAYEALGVEEYFTYEPPDEYVEPRLRGWRREGGALVPIEPEWTDDGHLRLRSDRLGLFVEDEGSRLRLRDLETGEPLLFADEEAEARRQAEEARRQADAEVARLKAELESLSSG